MPPPVAPPTSGGGALLNLLDMDASTSIGAYGKYTCTCTCISIPDTHTSNFILSCLILPYFILLCFYTSCSYTLYSHATCSHTSYFIFNMLLCMCIYNVAPPITSGSDLGGLMDLLGEPSDQLPAAPQVSQGEILKLLHI